MMICIPIRQGHVWSDFTLFLSKLNTDWTPCRLALTPDWTPTALALTPALNVSPIVSNYRPQQKTVQIRQSKQIVGQRKSMVVFSLSWFSTDWTTTFISLSHSYRICINWYQERVYKIDAFIIVLVLFFFFSHLKIILLFSVSRKLGQEDRTMIK